MVESHVMLASVNKVCRALRGVGRACNGAPGYGQHGGVPRCARARVQVPGADRVSRPRVGAHSGRGVAAQTDLLSKLRTENPEVCVRLADEFRALSVA